MGNKPARIMTFVLLGTKHEHLHPKLLLRGVLQLCHRECNIG